MEKFSLYEFLSFLLPGVALWYACNFIATQVFGYTLFYMESFDLANSLLYLLLALVAGLFVHFITVTLTKEGSFAYMKWYRKLVFPFSGQIINGDVRLKNILPVLEKYFKEINPDFGNPTTSDYFDSAYYHFETEDKIAPIKSFQSLYFLVRNLMTIFLITALLLAFLSLLHLVSLLHTFNSSTAYKIIGCSIFLFLLLIPLVRWLRYKMVERLLFSYYYHINHKKSEQKK